MRSRIALSCAVFSSLLSACIFPIDVGSFDASSGQGLIGGACDSDSDCNAELSCVDGTCSDASERTACTSDADCEEGLCSRDGLCTALAAGVGPIIVITETAQGLGEIAIGESSIGDTVIENVGDADLVVDAASFTGEGADQFFIATDVTDNGDGTATVAAMSSTLQAPLTIEPGQALSLFSVFQPTRVGDFTVELLVHSNDIDTPELGVALRGVASENARRP